MNMKKMRITNFGLRNEKEFGLQNLDCGITTHQCCALPFRNSQSAIRNPHSSRRGILLLVVLSMLTLFLLIGTAFIVSANHYRKTLKTFAKATEASNSSIDQGNLLNEVLNQLVRDTNNQSSSLRFHSLLRDMYGNDGILAEINVAEWATEVAGDGANLTGGQMLQFLLDPATVTDQFGISLTTMRAINNAYNGLVLTFLDGPVRGQSVRVVGHIPVATGTPGVFNARLRVMTPRRADGSNLVDPSKLNTSRILINGRPFNGTGAGYNRWASAGNAKLNTQELVSDTNREVSLLPNATFLDFQQLDTNGTGTYGAFFSNRWNLLNPQEQRRLIDGMGFVGQGGSDESYDAVDFQNMMLAMLPVNPQETVLPDPSAFDPTDLGQMVIPSLHRPALLNYWRQQLQASGTPLELEPNLLRKVLLRPNWLDHPNFTGSNPDFAILGNPQDRLRRMIYGPWDVDNDNDGIRDSVWVDFGASVMENADGRLVKPMAAIMVLDMDSRLNLNAHGSQDIANAHPNPTFSQQIAGAGNTTNLLAQGQGFGPAEISLGPLMPGPDRLARWEWYKRFFDGTIAGESYVPTTVDIAPAVNPRKFRRRRFGKMGGRDTVPGRLGFDMAAQMKMQGVPPRAANNTTGPMVRGSYVSPPDYRGRYAVGLNDMGQPVYEAMGDTASMNTNTPYEVDLSLGASRGESADADDGAYSVAELERILRPYDADAGALPSRLWKMAGEFKDSSTDTTPNLDKLNLWRTSITTDSYDLPVPSVVVPAWMRRGPDGVISSDDFVDAMNKPALNLSFVDLLEYRIRLGMNPTTPSAPLTPAQRREIRRLLPQDLADGLRLDINRPIGNGRDDNSNGVVDEPGEDEGSFWASNPGPNSLPAPFTSNTTGRFRDAVDRDGDGIITDFERGDTDASGSVDTLAERVAVHNFRRQMLAKDIYVLAMTLADPFDLNTKEGKAKARQLAQWAINVVDFRDPDNIMTAFEYDVNPFDGWAVDGNTGVVADWVGLDAKANTNDDLGGVVWGAESPELLMTETIAWHDRRTENHGDEDPDNDEDGDGKVNHKDRGTVPKSASPGSGVKIPDSDFDQRFVPVGAGFVEIYCPVPENPATNADTHDTITTPGTDLGINLTRVADGSPCWRLMVYKTNLDGNAGPEKDPDSLEFADIPKLADRCVYFTSFDPESLTRPGASLNWDDDGVAFYSTLNTPTITPGRYMVVGGGDGTNQYKASLGSEFNQTKYSNIGITLDATPSTAAAVTLNGAAAFTIPSDVASVALIDQPRRFTFSEPAKGYPVRVAGSTRQPGPPNSGDIYVPILDIPLDDQRLRIGAGTGLGGGGGGKGGGLAGRAKGGKLPFQDNEVRLMLPPPSVGGGGLGGGGGGGGGGIGGPDPTKAGRTIPGFSWVYLQRLANPLLPWNPEPLLDNGTANTKHDDTLAVNPYMTIDAMGVSVTVFNGLVTEELRRNLTGKGNQISRYKNVMAGQFFTSVERGRNNMPLEPAGNLSQLQDYATNRSAARISAFIKNNPPASLVSNLWNPESVGYTAKGIAGLSRNTVPQNPNNNFRANPKCTLGSLNQSFGGSPSSLIEPQTPFPWYTWNNRPYANANELLLVPAFRSSQLLKAFSYQTATNNKFNYDGKVTEIPLSKSENLVVDGPFGHLLNFFRTDSKGTDGQLLTADDQGIAGLHRLLDYVHVPSPFVGTETWMNPARFGSSNVSRADDPRYLRQPPFNRIAEYREPGRINPNTVVSADVWDGGVLHRERFDNTIPWDPFSNNYRKPNSLTGAPGHTGPLFLDPTPGENGLMENRRGYTVFNTTGTMPDPLLDNSMLALDPNVPTFFANPYRSADAGSLVPLPQLRREASDCLALRSDKVPRISDAANNLMTDVITPDPTSPNRLPPGLRSSDTPALLSKATEEFRNATRNPYFSYRPLTRLSSMTTTRSNVYAVWVTIGFFEVEKAPSRNAFASNNGFGATANTESNLLYDKVYPEGYAFGKEAGSDTGDIRRVREFAMIDRTVPVAFEPGQNHNVDKAIRLRRRID